MKETAAEALPKKLEHKPAESKVSDRTKNPFKKRDKIHPGKNTKEEFTAIRREIQEFSI